MFVHVYFLSLGCLNNLTGWWLTWIGKCPSYYSISISIRFNKGKWEEDWCHYWLLKKLSQVNFHPVCNFSGMTLAHTHYTKEKCVWDSRLEWRIYSLVLFHCNPSILSSLIATHHRLPLHLISHPHKSLITQPEILPLDLSTAVNWL